MGSLQGENSQNMACSRSHTPLRNARFAEFDAVDTRIHMDRLPLPEWQEALERMETSLKAAEKALCRSEERYELGWAPSAGDGEFPIAWERLESRWAAWNQRLEQAEQTVHEAERELHAATNSLESWRKRFADWQQLLQQQQSESAR